jgi:hypothetical protein
MVLLFLLRRHHRHLRFEFGPVWRQSGGGGDAAASAHLLPEELFVADFDIAIHARPSDSVDAAALIEYPTPHACTAFS